MNGASEGRRAARYRAGVMVPWRQAWHDALYGESGFYRRTEGPAGPLTTSPHEPLGGVLAQALGQLRRRPHVGGPLNTAGVGVERRGVPAADPQVTFQELDRLLGNPQRERVTGGARQMCVGT